MLLSTPRRIREIGIFLIIGGVLLFFAVAAWQILSFSIAATRVVGRQPDTQPRPVSLSTAKTAIPKALDVIYASLDQGEPGAAARYLSPRILNSTAEIDSICRPFNFRSHYVEAIIARPQDRFQVRLRTLFKPLDERAYTMVFHLLNDQPVLEDVKESGDDWFGPQKAEANNIVRRFIYSMKARQDEIARKVVSPNFPFSQCIEDEDIRRHLDQLEEVRLGEPSLEQYLGLHIVVDALFPENPGGFKSHKKFYLEPIGGTLKIVRAFYSRDVGQRQAYAGWRWGHSYEDPDMEGYTLKRFASKTEGESH